jgi:predicted MFS family arabinose efflux permease
MIGITIGITFSISMVLSPMLDNVIHVPGIFALTGVLALLAIGVVKFMIPDPAITHFHSDTEASGKHFVEVLRNKDLLRLDFGIFSLHAILMSVFMQVPFVMEKDGLALSHHWYVYLPVMLVAFVLMVPPIIIAEKKAKMKQIFMLSIFLAMCAQVLLMYAQNSLWGVAAALLVFFTAFNVLEATLPSMISKIAPLAAKGTAMGVYSSVQFLGAFSGASIGGALLQFVGGNSVFVFAIVMLLLWLIVASTMKPPALVRTRLYHLPKMDEAAAVQLQKQLMQLQGVKEAMVVAVENIASLKVDMQGFDEAAVDKLMMKGA